MNSNPLIAGNCSGGRIFKSWGIFRDGKRIATMEPDALSPEQELALAKAFAAAPELLAALQAIVNGRVRISDKANDMLSEHDPKVISARAAIAKARGN